MSQRWLHSMLFVAALVLGAVTSRSAHAQSTIKHPGDRPAYVFEAEPHLDLGLFDPPGWGAGTGYGLGFRGSVELVKNGFIPKLNNSVAIGFGLDYLRYDRWHGPRAGCEEFAPAPNGVPVCVRTTGSINRAGYVFIPVVMQWNFWLHKRWSVFGEPGLAIYHQDRVDFAPFIFYAGGRFHFTDNITLTMRVGYPTLSLGVSFLL